MVLGAKIFIEMNISDRNNDKNSDFFHEIVMAEQKSQSIGFEEGLEAGKSAGFSEGQKLGWEKGATIGSEVGFYSGFAKTILKHMEKDPTFKPRAVKPVRKLIQLIEAYSLTDPQNPELQTGLEEIRSKFKQPSDIVVMGFQYRCCMYSKPYPAYMIVNRRPQHL